MHWKMYHALAHYSDLAFYFLVTKKEHTSHVIVRFVVRSVQLQNLAYKFSFSLLRLLLPVSFLAWVCPSYVYHLCMPYHFHTDLTPAPICAVA